MSETKVNNLLGIPGAAISFAAGLSLIGQAVGGPSGAVIGAVGGAILGVCAEIVSQMRHRSGSQASSSNAVR